MDPTRFDPLIDLLLTVGYIDGTFDQRERDYVRAYLARLVPEPGHFDAVFARLETELAALAAEVVASDDHAYVKSRLKVRALGLFRDFAPGDQAVALELVDGLVGADGTIAPAERALHDELRALFQAAAPVAAPTPSVPVGELLRVEPARPNALAARSHPLLEPLEQPYAADATARQAQVGRDYELIFGAIATWERQRARGNGRLAGVGEIGQLAMGTRLLDGHVHVLRPDRPTELIVIGDLHGCYACFKAALLQSDFIDRARRFQDDPINNPDIKLVLLGDYIDRGRFGFEGVLRAALQLLVTLPNHVILLRGNHEFLVRFDNRIVSAVSPAEAVPGITDRVSVDILEAYRHLFDHMPTSFLFDRTLFVHGGIPRDDTIAARYHDLSSLDDPTLRFEMMWSDPATTEHVPAELQRETTRFAFGRQQFNAFMARLGCHAMIRGHEQVEEGFRPGFEIDGRRLYTLFSAGGHDNPDLPPESRYRSVTPMALSIRRDGEATRAIPWPIEYQPFTTAEHNGLYR